MREQDFADFIVISQEKEPLKIKTTNDDGATGALWKY